MDLGTLYVPLHPDRFCRFQGWCCAWSPPEKQSRWIYGFLTKPVLDFVCSPLRTDLTSTMIAHEFPIPSDFPLLRKYCSEHVISHHSIVQHINALGHWKRHFGAAQFRDVSPEQLAAFSRLLCVGRKPPTVNKIRRHLRVLMSYAVEIGEMDTMPRWKPLPELDPVPIAFTDEEFGRGLAVARQLHGSICGIRANIWWESLLLSIWYSGVRIGAMLAVAPKDVLISRAGFYAHAENQKDRAGQYFTVGEDCVSAWRAMQRPTGRKRQWPWRHQRKTLNRHFRKIFEEEAGIPLGDSTGCLFHRIRKSTASYIDAGGGNATKQLGHSAESVTRRYLDPRITGANDSTRHMPRLS